MLNSWILCGIILCCSILQIFGDDGDIGPGLWHVHYIKKCDEENHVFKFDISKRKINRTHDGYSGKFTLNEKYTDEYGIRLDICKHVDGGCKQVQVFSDQSSVSFMKKYAEKNVRACLEYAGIDPADFPIEKGEYEIDDYVFDYTELPKNGIYGSYGTKAFLLNGTDEIGCVELQTEFKELEECDDEDCDDEK